MEREKNYKLKQNRKIYVSNEKIIQICEPSNALLRGLFVFVFPVWTKLSYASYILIF